MSLGLYVHIPFCLQQCSYCDFTTKANDYSLHQQYVDRLLKEIRVKSPFIKDKNISSLYFGGGTPSLLTTNQLDQIVSEFKRLGFNFSSCEEITIEINPGTISQESLDEYQSIGINRFSLGVQSFDDHLLKTIGRKHGSKESFESLELLNINQLNYSFDLLFSLPNQSIDHLKKDLNLLADFKPPHISTYYLTIPEKHKLNKGRPPEEIELSMFDLVENSLEELGYRHYEISNHCLAGKHSIHNLSAWKGEQYWGVGISAHSHIVDDEKKFRFWNPNSEKLWLESLDQFSGFSMLPDSQCEELDLIDQLNDIVHTSLRLDVGLNINDLNHFEANKISELIHSLNGLVDQGFLQLVKQSYILTKKGRRTLNFVLEKLFITKT